MIVKKISAMTIAILTAFALVVSLSACDTGPSGSVQNTVTATTNLPSPQPESVINTPEPTTNSAPAQATIQATETAMARAEQPVAAETNPPGDIPDTQAFVLYSSKAGGYELEVPEGWARTETGSNVRFVDKLDGVMVTLTDTATAPTAENVRANQATALQSTGRAVQVTSIKDVQLPAGSAVLIEYTSNSEPNEVTGKQVRLENNTYLFYKDGKMATLTLWAPLGADNVDQWQRMSQSFKWR